jgi:hypothetical protein
VEHGPGLFVSLLASGDSSLQKLDGLIVTAQILQKTGFESSNSRGDPSPACAVLEVPVGRCELLARHLEAVEKPEGVAVVRRGLRLCVA